MDDKPRWGIDEQPSMASSEAAALKSWEIAKPRAKETDWERHAWKARGCIAIATVKEALPSEMGFIAGRLYDAIAELKLAIAALGKIN